MNMALLLGLAGFGVLLEAYLVYVPQPDRRIRAAVAAITMAVCMFSFSGLVLLRWPIWLGVWIVQLYQLINVLRVAEARLPAPERHRLAVRSFWWLLLLQGIIVAVAYALAASGWLFGHGFAIVAVVQLVVALVLVRATWRTWRRTRLPREVRPRSDAELPTLSVLIPARNETDDLEACLTTLVANDYPKLEVIVLDDCSVTRRTPEIIRMFAHDGVQFIAGEAPDEKNWLAKNQAYDRLARAASGEILLFCGVDVRFGQQTLRVLLETLLARQKQMMSVLPLSAGGGQAAASLIQPMRYWWELALPRRFFNRPPVLSTCWLITRSALKRGGGFKAVSRKIVPEAYFARQLTASDAYSFIRSGFSMGLTSVKSVSEQRATAIRTRYPQLHRRIEMAFLVTFFELACLIGPLVLTIGLLLARPQQFLWLVPLAAQVCLLAVYYRIAVRTKLNNRYLAWLLFPFAVLSDVALLHISMWQYEFSTVIWKDRNVCIPVMHVEPKLPDA